MQIPRICAITRPELYDLYVVDLTRKTYPTNEGKGYSHSRTHPSREPEGTSRPLQEDQKELIHPPPPHLPAKGTLRESPLTLTEGSVLKFTLK